MSYHWTQRQLDAVLWRRFGRLTVFAQDKIVGRYFYWQCRCDCGQVRSIEQRSLLRSLTRSCGCLQREWSTKHGMARTSEYRSWRAMFKRCDPKHPQARYYAEQGVTICPQWHRFEVFYADMGPKPTLRHSLDRYPDPFGNYEPANCRWATAKEQIHNRRPMRRRRWGTC